MDPRHPAPDGASIRTMLETRWYSREALTAPDYQTLVRRLGASGIRIDRSRAPAE